MRHVEFNDPGDTAENRFLETDFLVEATNNEWFMLWSRWCKDSNECLKPLIKEWKQLGGWILTIGRLLDRPICLSLQWTSLDGFIVCNWTPTSELVDYRMIEKWLENHFTGKTGDGRRAVCNSSNFHFVTQEMERRGLI